jgi:peptide-methionine (S)-S-oxide reductase
VTLLAHARIALGAAALLAGACTSPALAESVVATPAARLQANETPANLKTAIFAGGCFWGVEGVFSHVKGVTSAVSGYHGGAAKTAKYDLVGGGDTGHAEAVRVTYDPAIVRYDELLRVFFAVVTDPTQLNRQGPDTGSQYRNALVPTSPEQGRVAAAYLAQLKASRLWSRPLVTRIEPYKGFHPAEAYHQDFMLANPEHGYIQRWDAPKVAAFRKLFPTLYRATFVKG